MSAPRFLERLLSSHVLELNMLEKRNNGHHHYYLILIIQCSDNLITISILGLPSGSTLEKG